MSDTGSNSKNPQEAAKADAKAAKAKRREVNAGTQVAVGEHAREEGYVPRFKKRYMETIKPELMKKFGYTNIMQVPKINKVVLNIGAGEAASDGKKIVQAQNDLTAIAGQKAVITRAKKAISTFKITAGRPVGVKVTLRRDQMYEFYDRLVNFALPRVRDFKGVSPKAFDGRGNYTLGVREEIIFPEINFEKLDKPKGMNITFNTTAANDEQGRALLRHLGMPFRN